LVDQAPLKSHDRIVLISESQQITALSVFLGIPFEMPSYAHSATFEKPRTAATTNFCDVSFGNFTNFRDVIAVD